MKDKIIEAYEKLRFSMKDTMLFEKFNVVIQITPKAYCELRAEGNEMIRYINTDFIEEIHFLNLFGEKTPLIINNSLPENVEFIIQTQKDYERLEHKKLIERLNKMFY
jgi:hypothetical protein